MRWQQRLDHFLRSQLELTCEESDPEVATEIDQCHPHCHPPFLTPNAMEVSLPEEDDIHALVSATLASHESMATTSICCDFLSMMTISVRQAGLAQPPLLIPKPVNRLSKRFYDPTKPSQPALVLLAFPDIWQCVVTSWHQPLKRKVPLAS